MCIIKYMSYFVRHLSNISKMEEPIHRMLKLGVDVKCIDNTALHFFDMEYSRIIKMLIEAGCDPAIRNNEDVIAKIRSRRNERGDYINVVDPKRLLEPDH